MVALFIYMKWSHTIEYSIVGVLLRCGIDGSHVNRGSGTSNGRFDGAVRGLSRDASIRFFLREASSRAIVVSLPPQASMSAVSHAGLDLYRRRYVRILIDTYAFGNVFL
jgi:hypothetical protein